MGAVPSMQCCRDGGAMGHSGPRWKSAVRQQIHTWSAWRDDANRLNGEIGENTEVRV